MSKNILYNMDQLRLYCVLPTFTSIKSMHIYVHKYSSVLSRDQYSLNLMSFFER